MEMASLTEHKSAALRQSIFLPPPPGKLAGLKEMKNPSHLPHHLAFQGTILKHLILLLQFDLLSYANLGSVGSSLCSVVYISGAGSARILRKMFMRCCAVSPSASVNSCLINLHH